MSSSNPKFPHRLKRATAVGLQIIGVLLLLFIASLIYERLRYGRFSPPKHVTNIHEFRKWQPEFTRAQEMSAGGATYYVVQGPVARMLASGPSEYYFDHVGNYVGRNIDPGDFSEPALFLQNRAARKTISIDQIPKKQ